MIFHDPIEPKDFGSREELMAKVRAVIDSGLPEYQECSAIRAARSLTFLHVLCAPAVHSAAARAISGSLLNKRRIFQPQLVIHRRRAADDCPAAISPATPLCGVTIAPSPTLQWPTTPTCPVRITFLPISVEPARPTCAAQQSILANLRAVADLHQVVDLHASANASFPYAGAIDAGIGLHLHVISDHHRLRLYNLVPVPCPVLGESETIRANDYSILQNHAVSQAAILAHHGMRMREKVIPDLRARDRSPHAPASPHRSPISTSSINHHVGTHMRARADFRRGMHHRRRMHSRLIAERLMEQLHGAGEIQVWILAPQHGRE